jgi:hypothetical protein
VRRERESPPHHTAVAPKRAKRMPEISADKAALAVAWSDSIVSAAARGMVGRFSAKALRAGGECRIISAAIVPKDPPQKPVHRPVRKRRRCRRRSERPKRMKSTTLAKNVTKWAGVVIPYVVGESVKRLGAAQAATRSAV